MDKIIVDCFGGDFCPEAPVNGALLAINENSDLKVTLCGDQEKISAILATKEYDKTRVEILDAKDVITNDDSPVLAIRRKKESSMVVALRALSEGDYDGLVSSGNTGSLLAGATLIVKLINGVTRATLAPISPTAVDGKYTLICDAGANVDCKAAMLKEFAIMGDIYMRSAFGIAKPTIALLNNGAEEEKGNLLTKEAHALLKDSGLNFVGNIEANDFVSGKVDVIVTDGFAGNIAVKSTEGMAKNFFKMMKDGIMKGGLKAKLGFILLKSVLKGLKSKMSTDEVGGAVFLGARKVVVKAHGSSKEIPFKAAILQASKMAKDNVVGLIEEGLKGNEQSRQS